MIPLPTERARCRRIVADAAQDTDSSTVRAALWEDSRGVFECDVAQILSDSADRAAALGLTCAEVDEQVKTLLLLRVLTAALRA